MHWVAALAASTIDLFRDVDYIFSHSGRDMSLRPRDASLCFLMIIWSPSHVYVLFIVVFVTNLYHCYYGLWSWCAWRYKR